MAIRCPFCDRRIRMKDVDFERDAATCRGCSRQVAFSSLPGVGDNPSVRRLMERMGVQVGSGAGSGFGSSRDGSDAPGSRSAIGERASDGANPYAADTDRAGSMRPTTPAAYSTATGATSTPPGPMTGSSPPADGRAGMLQPAIHHRTGAGAHQFPHAAPNLAQPPRGTWYRDDGITLEVGASTRSVAGAIFMLLVAGFWCSITGIFVIMALVGIAQGLGLAGGGNHGGAAGVGGSLFMLLFSTPFVAIGLWLLWSWLMSLAGREVVTIRGDALEHFSGIGPVGFRKRLSATAVRRVDLDVKVTRTKNGTSTTRTVALHTDAAKPVKFGAMLKDERRNFMIDALRQILAPQGGR